MKSEDCQLDLDGCYALMSAILRLAFMDAIEGKQPAIDYLTECDLLRFLERFTQQTQCKKYWIKA